MHHVIILALITSPWEPPLPETADAATWQALKEVALILEIVGPEERWVPSFASEVRYCRSYYHSLVGAPPIADVQRFAGYAPHVASACAFNYAAQDWCRDCLVQSPHRQEEIGELLTDLHRRGCAWECLHRASSGGVAWASKRAALMRLREAIGDQAYYSGEMPCVVPVERWREIE